MALHAIDQINKNPTILPGVELILNLTADCWIDTIALHRVRKNVYSVRVYKAKQTNLALTIIYSPF